jgi:hypothetical protein
LPKGLPTYFELNKISSSTGVSYFGLHITKFTWEILLDVLELYTGLFTTGILLNFYFAATNNTNGSIGSAISIETPPVGFLIKFSNV